MKLTADMVVERIDTTTTSSPPATRSTIMLRATSRVDDAAGLEHIQRIQAEVIGYTDGFLTRRVRVTIEFLDD